MWKEIEIDAPDVIAVECIGKLSEEDFERMHTWLDRKLARRDKPALIIFAASFEGYEDISAFWADVKVETTHVNDFSRIAVVADQKWLEWSAKAADPVTSTDLKWFETAERDAAISWAKSQEMT